jgi:drug/metabolite transporter (DMT)-like permease
MRGARWMAINTLCFAVSYALVKKMGNDLPVAVIVFFRCLVGFLFMAPFVLRHGLVVFHTKRPGAHITRLVCASASMLAGYYAFTHMPLATAAALTFTRPLFMIVLAILFLGEVVRWRRGLATVLGFVGVLIILGPNDIAFHPAALAALFSAAAVSGAMAVVRQQAAVEGSMTLIAWFMTGSTILTLFPALLVWQTPQGIQWVYLAAIGVTASVGQFCFIKAFTYGEATVMNPIDYSQLLFAAALGFLFFEEIPTIWTAIGTLVIAVSTLYILLRESKVSAKPPAPLIPD